MLEKTYAVIMAGGKGERFWPLSTSRHPKRSWRSKKVDSKNFSGGPEKKFPVVLKNIPVVLGHH